MKEFPTVVIIGAIVSIIPLLLYFGIPRFRNSNSKEVQIVKNLKHAFCPEATVEKMVDSVMASPSWDSDKSDDGTVFVNVSGDVTTVFDKRSHYMIQYVFDKDKKEMASFRTMIINNVPQNIFASMIILNGMCSSATARGVKAM